MNARQTFSLAVSDVWTPLYNVCIISLILDVENNSTIQNHLKHLSYALCILHSVLETWSCIESEQKWDTGSLIQEDLLQTWHINALKVDFYYRNIWNGWIMVMRQNQMIISCLDSVMWSSKMHHFQHAADVIEHSKQNHQKKMLVYYKIFLLELTGFIPSISFDIEARRSRPTRHTSLGDFKFNTGH